MDEEIAILLTEVAAQSRHLTEQAEVALQDGDFDIVERLTRRLALLKSLSRSLQTFQGAWGQGRAADHKTSRLPAVKSLRRRLVRGVRARHVTDGRYHGLWPVPGGADRYFETTLAILGWIGSGISQAALVDRLLQAFPKVHSRETSVGYIEVVQHLGFLDKSRQGYQLSTAGRALLETHDRNGVGEALARHITLIPELLDRLEAGPLTIGQLWRKLDHSWQTDAQLQYRLDWLRAAGWIRRTEDGRFTLERVRPIEK